ncbi:MAG: hypothetical protein ABIG44_16015 [Planctomycetota bacterium]
MFRSSTTGFTILTCAILTLAGSTLWPPAVSHASDGQPRQQPPGVHSTVCTSDGQIRDDFLAQYLADEIVANDGQVLDVKIFANTCYGGGLEDDFALIFGPSGPCAGVPWVFASAADWDEQSWAFRASWCADPVANLGSKFTSALAGPHSGHWDATPGAMRDGVTHNVVADCVTARQHDEAGPFHGQAETVIISYGNGGENLVWNAAGASHEIILFGGLIDQPAYINDMDNMTSALQSLYGSAPHNIQTVPNGTIQDLLDAVSAACANLDADTQLLLHFTDHGGFTFDVVEHYQSQGQDPPHTVPEFQQTVIWLPPPPWPKWPWPPPPPPPPPIPPPDDDDEVPYLDLWLLNAIDSEFWIVALNDVQLPLPPGEVFGELRIPVPWEILREGENTLTISAVGEPGEPFVYDHLELYSGRVAMQRDLTPMGAVCAAMEYGFIDPWLPGSAIPFHVPPQVARPEWDLGGALVHYYEDPRWPEQQGFWGVSGPEQTAVLTGHLSNGYSPAEVQQIVISADILANDPADDAWSVVVWPPDGDGLRPPAAHQPQLVDVLPNPDGSLHYTWEQSLMPVVETADVVITLKTGTSGDSYVFIDNLAIELTGQPKDRSLDDPGAPSEHQDKSRAQYYYFDRQEWPPEALYEVLPMWHMEATWGQAGTFPVEWMPEVTDHRGVLGLPGGFPADAELMVHLDGQAGAADRERVSYQFDYYSEGRALWWEPLVSPESTIENHQEVIEPLEDGWQRVRLSFDVVPSPTWHELRWLLSTNELSSPVVIDNFTLSSSTWWADYWHDAFDFHEAGFGLHGRYGWKGWDDNPLADGLVTDAQARSPFNALTVSAETDLVQEYDLPADRYVFTAWQYVPGDFQSGCDPTGEFCGSFFILLNTYEDGGPYHWSTQLHADSLTGSFIRDQQTPVAVPLITDTWVRIDVVVDLVADLYRVYYDGMELGAPASWTAGVFGVGGGALNITALDLYGNGSTEVYYDDIHLRPVVTGDLNWDDVVELDDVLLFSACLAGPEVACDPECTCADLDRDSDVDVVDFAVFQRVFTGP